jgi:hypothetical protein
MRKMIIIFYPSLFADIDIFQKVDYVKPETLGSRRIPYVKKNHPIIKSNN